MGRERLTYRIEITMGMEGTQPFKRIRAVCNEDNQWMYSAMVFVKKVDGEWKPLYDTATVQQYVSFIQNEYAFLTFTGLVETE